VAHSLANRQQTRRFYPSAVIEWGKAKLTFEYGDYVIPENFKLMGTRPTRAPAPTALASPRPLPPAAVAATHQDPSDHKHPESFNPLRFAGTPPPLQHRAMPMLSLIRVIWAAMRRRGGQQRLLVRAPRRRTA
jgi:hypothetical protein